MVRSTSLLLFLLCFVLVRGQDIASFYFERIDSESSGMISDVVNSIYQDENGFMWFATDEGILRYDGYELRSFKNDPSLGMLYGVQVNKIVTDSEGRKLLCTNQGFYAYTRTFEPTLQFAVDGLVNKDITECLVASSGKIYVSAGANLFEVDPVARIVTMLKLDDGRVNFYPKQIVEDARGRIWCGSWNSGLLLLQPGQKTLSTYKPFNNVLSEGVENSVYALFLDSRGYLWIGTWGCGLYVADISSDNEVNIIKSFIHQSGNRNTLPGNIIHTINEDSDNAIWIGTPYGLAAIRYPLTRKHKLIRYNTINRGDISSNVIKSIFKDRSDLLWIATKGGGVMKLNLNQKKFTTIQIPELDPQLRTQAVHAFETDHKGRLLIGVLSLGFVVYDSRFDKFFNYKDIPEYQKLADDFDLNTVNTFLWDQDSALWMGTRYNGLIRFIPKSGEIEYINSNSTNRAFRGREVNILCLANNGDVYAGTELGLNRISHDGKGGFNTYYIDFDSYISNLTGRKGVTGIVDYENHSLLVATESAGLFQLELDKGSTKVVQWSGDEKALKIITMFKDSNKRIWIGTKGKGILYIDKDEQKFVSPNPEQSVIGDIVYGINQDSYGNIWFTTNHGLSKFSWNKPSAVERYSYRNGLQGDIFIARSFYRDKNGYFCIGGHNGFNRFDPLQINRGNDPFNIVITDVFVDGVRYPYFQNETKTIEINHTHNDFSIVFASLSYIFPEANQYAYKVDGIDNDWKYVNAQMRSANYSNLEAGTYTLKIKGTNAQGVWNNDGVAIDIVVKPNPYFSWWAYLIYLLFILSILVTIAYFRLKAFRVKQLLRIEQIEHQKAEKLNQYKLRFFTNISHELLTPLSILSSAVEIMNLKKEYSPETILVMERTTNNLNRLIRSLLLFRKVETGNMKLKLTEGDISGFVFETVSSFKLLSSKKNIRFDINIEPDVFGYTDLEKLEMILHNLLSNAFRYTPDGGGVSFSLRCPVADNGFFECVVGDTGIGISKELAPHIFDRFYQLKNENGGGGIGVGLNLTKSLVNILGGDITVESEESLGALFTVRLPLTIEAMNLKSKSEEEGFEIEIDNEQLGVVDKADVSPEVFPEPENWKKYTLLIVEDKDDYRKMLTEALHEKFRVVEATNGAEALEVVKEKEIDLIVSDVQIPLLSGRELCRRIKNDLQISHIPVILLTAKVGEEERLSGYEAGADAYLEKPVKLKLLIIRIQALLRQRIAIMRNFKSELIFEPENVSVTPLDEKFIIEAKNVVEKYIADPDFSVKVLAEELNASNSMLYRKMRTLIDVSPSEFIRNIRLRRAAQLLENEAFSVSEVAYNCGFNDLSYFGSCFKKMYGVTPTSYQSGDRRKT
ncbi:hybrid sensor histidine kinase/response regulator transcription factor [Draconibacterium sediminis]|nr:two-component regulator propeller domain-containing protein [Draconibacterium sediminis]